jgi:hypothetical protein
MNMHRRVNDVDDIALQHSDNELARLLQALRIGKDLAARPRLGGRVKTFLFVITLALLFVLGPVLAMRPSPRQAQLARLRAHALTKGLRVRVTGSGAGASADYVLPWRIGELQDVRGLRLEARCDEAGAWECRACDALSESALRAALAVLPAGATGLRSTDEGLAAQWDEKGREDGVERICGVLSELREALVAARRAGDAMRGEADIRT